MNNIMKIIAKYPGLESEAARKLINNLASSDKNVLKYISNATTMQKNLQTKYAMGS